MTHEQKPKSAEFPDAVRSRYSSAKEGYGITLCPSRSWEEQAKAMTRMVLDGVCEQRGHDFTAAYLAEHLAEAEARGAAEQRRKDAAGAEAWLGVDHSGNGLFTEDRHLAGIWEDDGFNVPPLYTRPASVGHFTASFDWLVEDMHKGVADAPPSARFDMLFGDDEVSISEARERLKALGIESLYITDDWEAALEGNELSRADVDALPPLHEDERKAGWNLASAWDTEDGTIIRHYVRSLCTLDQGAHNVAVLEARVKELEGAITALFDGQACFENLGFEDPPLRVVVYDDEQIAAGKDLIGVAVKGAKIIAAALRDGGE
ncbi:MULTISPECIES: hypothetical protein [Asaia]|uniref:hypothetical protein n=1 Tax=Asaia TaxID=91914 RepID=UPI002FC37CA9